MPNGAVSLLEMASGETENSTDGRSCRRAAIAPAMNPLSMTITSGRSAATRLSMSARNPGTVATKWWSTSHCSRLMPGAGAPCASDQASKSASSRSRPCTIGACLAPVAVTACANLRPV